MYQNETRRYPNRLILASGLSGVCGKGRFQEPWGTAATIAKRIKHRRDARSDTQEAKQVEEKFGWTNKEKAARSVCLRC